MAGTTAVSAPEPSGDLSRRSLYQEAWWLDAACPQASGQVVESRNGAVVGVLPYACFERDGFSWCGAPPLTRLAFPVVDAGIGKYETVGRTRYQIESELIRGLPAASVHEFILPPDDVNVLAWQSLGFEARVQHTFRIAAGTAEPAMWEQLNHKTRNLVRRAQELLRPEPLDADAFTALYRRNLSAQLSPDESARVGRLATAAIAHEQGRAVGVVDADGRMHGAALFVWDATDYYYFLSTRDADLAALGAVDYLVWLGMTDAMARGRRFDFDGVSSTSRLRFLQSFGGLLATRIVVTRRRFRYEGRLLMRRLRHRVARGAVREEFP